jgi:hypothetical protein
MDLQKAELHHENIERIQKAMNLADGFADRKVMAEFGEGERLYTYDELLKMMDKEESALRQMRQ